MNPTGHAVAEARKNGFGNVHDYLVHKETGQTPVQIRARKGRFSWGGWLTLIQKGKRDQ